MDLQLTDEQLLLSQAVRQMVLDETDVLGLMQPSSAEKLWQALVAFGALHVGDESDALGAVELVLVSRVLGEFLTALPFRDSAALRYVFGDGLGVADEATAFAVALSEPGRRYAPLHPTTSLRAGRIIGVKRSVPFAKSVDRLAITSTSANGPLLAVLAAATPGIIVDEQLSLDASEGLSRLTFEGVEIGEGVVFDGPGAVGPITRLGSVGGVLAAAEAVGAAAAVLTLARNYAEQRTQFGHAIGSFQAVRHILAEAYVKVESSWSSVLYAAASLDEGNAECLRTASIAKAYASHASLEVAHNALQVFGGIAFTDEHPAHRFLRRIVSLVDQYGSAREHEWLLGRELAR